MWSDVTFNQSDLLDGQQFLSLVWLRLRHSYSIFNTSLYYWNGLGNVKRVVILANLWLGTGHILYTCLGSRVLVKDPRALCVPLDVRGVGSYVDC